MAAPRSFRGRKTGFLLRPADGTTADQGKAGTTNNAQRCNAAFVVPRLRGIRDLGATMKTQRHFLQPTVSASPGMLLPKHLL